MTGANDDGATSWIQFGRPTLLLMPVRRLVCPEGDCNFSCTIRADLATHAAKQHAAILSGNSTNGSINHQDALSIPVANGNMWVSFHFPENSVTLWRRNTATGAKHTVATITYEEYEYFFVICADQKPNYRPLFCVNENIDTNCASLFISVVPPAEPGAPKEYMFRATTDAQWEHLTEDEFKHLGGKIYIYMADDVCCICSIMHGLVNNRISSCVT